MALSFVREAKVGAFLYISDLLVKVVDVCAQEQKPIKPAWKIVVSNHQTLLYPCHSIKKHMVFTVFLLFYVRLQPPSPEIPRSAVALSETGSAIAWPSLGAAKETQKKKMSISAPATPVSRKVGLPSNSLTRCGLLASQKMMNIRASHHNFVVISSSHHMRTPAGNSKCARDHTKGPRDSAQPCSGTEARCTGAAIAATAAGA